VAKFGKRGFFQIRCTGGKAAQINALMNAIYLKQKLGKPFQIRHYSGSTGTFWEFEISDLLFPGELETVVKPQGVKELTSLTNGRRIPSFPSDIRGINRISLYRKLEAMGWINFLRKRRSEISISGQRSNLEKVSKKTSIVSGNFVPLDDNSVILEMENRARKLGLTNPFKMNTLSDEVVIHYRLGDMRIEPHRGFGEEESRVVDPKVFLEIISLYGWDKDATTIRVVSDEPKIAEELLGSVGLKAELLHSGSTFWDDLNSMSKARCFIGSLSQMSILGGMLCARNGGRPVLPSDSHGEGDLKEGLGLNGISFHKFRYLSRSHGIFQK
jgi:hypothetical protein